MRALSLFSLLGLLLLQSCQYNSEEKAAKVVQTQKRGDAAGYNVQLGMGYLKQGDSPRAKRKLLMAMQLEPESPEVNSAMGYYLEKTGDIPEAKKYYKKALSLAPDSGSQLNNYGTFMCRQGKYEEAETYFLKAVNDVNYVNTAAAYENAGLCAAAIPDYAKAESFFTKALGQDSRRKQSLYELVSIELKQDQAEKALASLKKYPALSLNDPTLLNLAIEAAEKADKPAEVAQYKIRINALIADNGVKNDYDNNNG